MISNELLAEAIDGFERVGCQLQFCNGPTLEPEDMITCYVCETLAKLRVAAGLPPRQADEQTWEERHNAWTAAYMKDATGGRSA